MNSTLIFIIFLSFAKFIDGIKLTDIVQTNKGAVKGEILKTIHNLSIEYSSFRAIPYAKPPIGQLRFQPPVEIDSWSDTLIATLEAPACPQIDDEGFYFGNEDCLFLNVYSPWTSFEKSNRELLAVMVWIHGGEFIIGEINKKKYGPDFLIAENVVIVAMNYRIGALGFLSLDIPEVTGNMGLKDQVLALKWVQKNIEKFGGDPNRVTIFGQSAGSVSVLLHQISPASNGLFRGAIAMSGSPLNPWGFHSISSSKAQAFEMTRRLGFTLNKNYFFEKLQQVTAEEIVRATNNKTRVRFGMPTFRPTYENESIARDIFLSECPVIKYKSENYSKIPVMLGFTNAETIAFLKNFSEFVNTVNYSKVHFQSLMDLRNLSIFRDLKTVLNNSDKNIEHLDENGIFSAVNATTGLFFIAGIDSTQKYLAQSSIPIYYYRNSFDYKESRHRQEGINLNGTGHSDDLPQIWWQSLKKQPLDPNSRIGIQRKKMVKLWTNFAKYLNPTPQSITDDLLNVTWLSSGQSGLHLEIGNEKLAMASRPTDATVKAVQLTFEKYLAGCSNFLFN